MNDTIEFADLQKMSYKELAQYGAKNNINITGGSKIYALVEILKYLNNINGNIIYHGFVEIINGYGFIRDINNNFNPTPYDVYLSHKLIKEYDLRIGDEVTCYLQPKTEEDQNTSTKKLFCCKSIIRINDQEVHEMRYRPSFEELTAIYPTEQIVFESEAFTPNCPKQRVCRIVDLVAPIGFGQRAMIVAPPKSGKTTILHAIASSILQNYISNKEHKTVKLIIVLVGERPEEVTEMKRIAPGAEIVFSTFDEPAEQHIKTTEIIIERAKRLVENGYRVVILMDSITKLARSYNYVTPSSGKVLTGGVEAGALYKSKKFFGAARNTREGGSITIIATALVDTGSRMDEYIYEDFKGTGNSEITMERKFAEQKKFPAIDIRRSGTRRYELMLKEADFKKQEVFGAFLANMTPLEAIQFLINQVQKTPSNRALLDRMYTGTT